MRWTVVHTYVWSTGACIAKVIIWEPDFCPKMENKGERIIASSSRDRQNTEEKFLHLTKGKDALKFSTEELMNWKGWQLWGFQFWEHLTDERSLTDCFAICQPCWIYFMSLDLSSHFLELFWLFCDCCFNYWPSKEISGRYNMPLQKQGRTHGIFIDLMWLVKTAPNCHYILHCKF